MYELEVHISVSFYFMSSMELSLRKSIFCDKDLNNFKSSTSYTDILDFVKVYIYNLKTDSIMYV